jgi:hypothetical protein
MAYGWRGLPVVVRILEEIQDKIINQQKSWSQKQKVDQQLSGAARPREWRQR